MNESTTYFKYWGKADKNDPTRYHLLPYHCLDVAAVGLVLLDPDKPLCIHLSRQLNVESHWLRNFFSFCLTLHDIGKFSSAFQGLKKPSSNDLVKTNPRMPYTERHDSLGFWLWRQNLSVLIGKSLSGNTEWLRTIEPWFEIASGHHGIPPKKAGGRICAFFEQEDEEAALYFFQDAYKLFFAEMDLYFPNGTDLKKQLKPVSWQLAGVAVLADWMGSNAEHFKYCSKPMELTAYWHKHALPAADATVRSMPFHPRTTKFKGIGELFPFIKQPTPLQEYAINEPVKNKPQLFILEDVTGAGKTEAALILTHRLLSAGLAEGFYVALPTMATANSMYNRMKKVYRRFFYSSDLPSLILAHGARQLSEQFCETVILPENLPDDLIHNGSIDNQEFSAEAYCNAWLADNRKKALLADVGVGTLDQALLAVLPARHQSLRLLGLARKVLIVDEVHAYDSYMQKLLDTLLEAHARQGGSVILLSATLPQSMRGNLVKAFQRGISATVQNIRSRAYPLATHIPSMDKNEKHVDTREEVKRTVMVKRLDSEEAVIKQIQQAAEQGMCVCWVRNTVKAARNSYRELASSEKLNKDKLHLFHSRFAMVDRLTIEAEILKRFGDESTHEDRKGQVLISTQVVEQSLDLDFDVMITDLAPIDLVIQRAGRLKRHIRDAQGNRIRHTNTKDQRGAPVLYLFAPDPKDSADENWLKTQQEGTQAVYPHIGRLWLTAKLLMQDRRGKFSMPDDARIMIEGVYSDEAEDAIPRSLLEASMEAEGKDLTKRSIAGLNALKLNKGYTRSSGEWDEETHIPTRLTEQETVSVALANYFKGQLRPYAASAHHQWQMSVVKIPEGDWINAVRHLPTKIQKMIEDLKAEVKALRWLEVFPLMDKTAGYYNAIDGWQPETGEQQ